MTTPKMKVEVWTDIMCPYCYIGKIHYEKALERFQHADEVELVIKAFQLNVHLPDKGNGYPVVDYLTKTAGYSNEEVKKMFDYIGQLATDAGVRCNLPNAIAANTLDAHRLVKLAAKKRQASKVLTLISKAYFEKAADYSDVELLIKIGTECGLDETEMRRMFAGEDFKEEVLQEMREAEVLGIDTVPTFLFNRKQTIVGSESVEAFLDALSRAYEDWESPHESSASQSVKKGKACSPDGFCSI